MATRTQSHGNASHGNAAFDWEKCIFCQNTSTDKTSCPAESKRTDAGIGYKTVAATIDGFARLGQLPSSLKPFLAFWNEGDGIQDTFVRRKAVWHIKCKQRLVHGTRLGRLSSSPGYSEPPVGHFEHDHEDEDSACVSNAKNPRLTRSATNTTSTAATVDMLCFFCSAGGSDLRQVLTFAVDEKVRKCATILGDSILLGKLSQGDMIATEAKYHPACLLSLYYKAGRELNRTTMIDELAPFDCQCESLALAEVISYMEDITTNEIAPSVFKLSELNKIYCTCLSNYKVADHLSHSTRLKERLLENLPNLTAVTHGRDIFLTFSENVGTALQDLRQRASCDADAVHLMHTAKLLRREILSHTCKFNGNLQNDKHSVPSGLLYFITMVLEGLGDAASFESTAALSVAQLMVFNAQKRRRTTVVDDTLSQPANRHVANRETPLPIYMGLMLYSGTRKKILDKCHKLGLSISYDRVLQITNKIANAICSQYRSDDLVCPPVLKRGCFTVAAVDNIDHNLSSNTAQASFHGTAISLTQIYTCVEPQVNSEACTCFSVTASDLASDIILPISYIELDPCILPSKDPVVPHIPVILGDSNVTDKEYEWLRTVSDCATFDQKFNSMPWAAFHAGQDSRTSYNDTSSVLLPLFRQSANTAAMMRHSLNVLQNVVQHLNTRQVPVVTVDQPLYALMKQIQWHWPKKFGEQQFVILLGGLHTEMAALRMVGHWLAGSGWVECLVQSGITTSGVAESFISAAHVKRTRYAHTVTAAALYINLRQSYTAYCKGVADEVPQTFEEWRNESAKLSVQFQYWSIALDLELLILSFVRSIRMGDFLLYVQCLQELAPWFFVSDQTNYARWLPVHIRDMLSLNLCHPHIYEQFLSGNFTVSKTRRKFSSISIDQAHEQLNAVIKGDGGAVGLTDNDAALCRWAVTGPEIVRMLGQFESTYAVYSEDSKHHENTTSFRNQFQCDVANLLDILTTEMPFSTNTGDDLIVLCTNKVADKAVANTVRTAREMGKKQFESFFRERLSESATISVLSPLSRNKLPLFLYKPHGKRQTLNRLRVAELKADCHLFSRLYIACQTRDGNLDDFFRYENQAYPPSLSQGGTLYTGTKSDLLECLKISNCHDFTNVDCTASILDGAVVVQMIKPNSCTTFSDYRAKVFVPYLLSVLKKVERVDVVFDVYKEHSLKTLTRDKRGVGTRIHVVGHAKVPTNWHEFLRVDANKTELFHYLANLSLAAHDTCGKTVIITYDEHVRIAAGSIDVSGIECCNHEEADTRLILHSHHAAKSGCNKISIRTVDTDVVVLAIAFFRDLNLFELWIHFGVGRSARLIAIHEVCSVLEPIKCAVLPIFHALTGCDTTSAFYGKGKKSAWLTWDAYPELTQALTNLLLVTNDFDAHTISILQRFVILLYDRTSECLTLDCARQMMFTKKSKTLENIPPTCNAFIQHVKRAVYQAVHCWSHCLETQIQILDPSEWGWCKVGEKWQPQWMTIPQVSQMCQELICCSCKNTCSTNCKCVKAFLPCTSLCQCDGECERS